MELAELAELAEVCSTIEIYQSTHNQPCLNKTIMIPMYTIYLQHQYSKHEMLIVLMNMGVGPLIKVL